MAGMVHTWIITSYTYGLYDSQVSVVINAWYGPFYNDVQTALGGNGEISASDLYGHILVFCIIVFPYIILFRLSFFSHLIIFLGGVMQ